MAYKFVRGDTVRQIGQSDDLIVARVDETGEQYLLTQNAERATPQIWASEDEIELVKRASDSFTGLKPNLYIT